MYGSRVLQIFCLNGKYTCVEIYINNEMKQLGLAYKNRPEPSGGISTS